MSNIENYDKWSEVCDDDVLIKKLYDSGVRPGTEEFKELFGTPSHDGQPIGFKEFLFVIACLCLPILIVWALFKLVKFLVKKIATTVKRKTSKDKEES